MQKGCRFHVSHYIPSFNLYEYTSFGSFSLWTSTSFLRPTDRPTSHPLSNVISNQPCGVHSASGFTKLKPFRILSFKSIASHKQYTHNIHLVIAFVVVSVPKWSLIHAHISDTYICEAYIIHFARQTQSTDIFGYSERHGHYYTVIVSLQLIYIRIIF